MDRPPPLTCPCGAHFEVRTKLASHRRRCPHWQALPQDQRKDYSSLMEKGYLPEAPCPKCGKAYRKRHDPTCPLRHPTRREAYGPLFSKLPYREPDLSPRPRPSTITHVEAHPGLRSHLTLSCGHVVLHTGTKPVPKLTYCPVCVPGVGAVLAPESPHTPSPTAPTQGVGLSHVEVTPPRSTRPTS